MKRYVILFIIVLLVVSPIYASAGQAFSGYYDLAMGYIAKNDWEMALLALDVARNNFTEEETKLALFWSVAILKAQAEGKYTTSSMLYEGYNNAFGDAKKIY